MTKFIRWKADYSLLAGLEQRVEAGAKEVAYETLQEAQEIMYDMVTQREYPPASNPGQPPAMRSGALADSVGGAVIEYGWGGRSVVTGRFLSRSDITASMEIDTARYSPRGQSYAQALEDADYIYQRFFVNPAMRRAGANLPGRVRNLFQRGWMRKTTGQMWDGRRMVDIGGFE